MPLHHSKSSEVNAPAMIARGANNHGGWTSGGALAALAVSFLIIVSAIVVFLFTREKGVDRPVIESDLEAINQAGEEVRLSDLRGKVWAVTGFFAICPTCSRRNSTDLRTLAKRFADDPDFHLVSISIDPQTDGVKELKGYAEAFGADPAKWWFLTGDHEEIHNYLEDELLFPPVQERTNEAEIASLGRYMHDLGITVVDRQMRIVGKRDLAWAANQGNELKKEWERHLHGIIEAELRRAAP
jgi:protein SCO1/2